MTNDEIRIWKLERAIEHIDEAARILNALHDPVIDKEVMRHLDGNPAGWPGRLMRDILDERLEAMREDLTEKRRHKLS